MKVDAKTIAEFTALHKRLMAEPVDYTQALGRGTVRAVLTAADNPPTIIDTHQFEASWAEDGGIATEVGTLALGGPDGDELTGTYDRTGKPTIRIEEGAGLLILGLLAQRVPEQ